MNDEKERALMTHDQRMTEMLNEMDNPPPAAEAFTGMIYGPSGSGKTVLAAVLGKVLNGPDEKTLIVDTSRGYVSLGNHPSLNGSYVPIPYHDMASLETLAIMIERGHPRLSNIRTVVFDEISKMVRTDTNYLASQNGQDVPEWPDYNQSLNRMRIVLYRIMKRPDINFILLAHERDKKNKKGEVEFTFPDFIPSVVKELKEDIHVVARMTAAAVARANQPPTYTRLIQAMPTMRIDAKCRLPHMDVQVTPDFFVQHVKTWLDNGGKLSDAAAKQNVETPDLEVPVELRGLTDDSVADDAEPVWSA